MVMPVFWEVENSYLILRKIKIHFKNLSQ